MREQDIQRKIAKVLEKKGAWVIKVITANRNGCPDVLAVLNGRMIACEVKTPKGKVSELQLYHIEKIKKAGGLAGVVRSIEDLDKLLALDTSGPTVITSES